VFNDLIVMPGDCHLPKKSKTEQGARGEKHIYTVTFGCCRPATRAINRVQQRFAVAWLADVRYCVPQRKECHKKLTGRSPSHHYQMSVASQSRGTGKKRARRMRNTLFSLLQNVTRSYKRKGV